MATATTATLRISGQDYDLLHFRYGFHRNVDNRGYPTTSNLGGDIILTMESTKSTEFLEMFVNSTLRYPFGNPPRKISGSVEVCDTEDGMVLRRLVFEEAYIYAVGEDMRSGSPLPMTETIAISPLRLDVDRTVRLDRRWPQALFGWQAYVEEEQPVMFVRQEETQLRIVRVYWIDEHDEKRELSELFVGQSVTMCIEVEEGGAGKTLDINVEAPAGTIIKGGGTQKTYSGILVDSDNIAYIKDFQFESEN